MRDIKAKAEDFIKDDEIKNLLTFGKRASKEKNYVINIIDKAVECRGIELDEVATLLYL